MLPVIRLSFKQVKVEKEIENSEALFNNLIETAQKIQHKLKSNIDEKLRKSQDQDQVMIQKLKEEVTALQRMHSQLEEHSKNEDYLQHLQVSQPILKSKTWNVRPCIFIVFEV